MRTRIAAALEHIESEHTVRVLLAVESGKRAWGLATPEGRHELRIIYVHPTDRYLSIAEPRDVIEETPGGNLELCGWDLRKTLRMFAKCHVALNEWLDSPIVYAEASDFRRQLSELVPTFFNPIAAMNHYCTLAERAVADVEKPFDILRPLYACRWIEHLQSQPPTQFDKLLDAEWIEPGEREWAQQAQSLDLGSDRARNITTEIAHFKSLMTSLRAPAKSSTAPLDELLCSWSRAASVEERR